jgi:glutaminyl-peptide cyclotransferase
MKSSSFAGEIQVERRSSAKEQNSRPARWRRPGVLVGALVFAGGLCAIVMMPFFSSTASSELEDTKPIPAPVDGQRAFGYLKLVSDIGPRIAGSEANTRQRNMVVEHFKKLGASVKEEEFAAIHPLTGKRVKMVNVIGSWNPDRTERVVIGAHYDSRPFPDEEVDPNLRRARFIGANDGASGVALLMELAHHLKEFPTPWGVDLVLFDGEELVYEGPEGRQGEFFLGSKAFAKAHPNKKGAKVRYVAGFVVDMVAGKDLIIDKEPMSLKLAGGLVRQTWSVAERLDPPSKVFRNNVGREVQDDHLPLNNVGIPTIDIIDFEYPHWHRASDIPENCAPEGLKEVGRVLTGWLSLPKPPPAKKTRR